MSKITSNVRVYSDQNYAVWTAPFGTTPPTTLPPVAPVGFYELGLLSDQGLTEAHNLNETKIYDMAGALVRIARNQEERPWTFEALERNAVVLGLRYPGSSVSSVGATAEVQTVTITGTPTGGTFTLSLAGYGSASALAYNIPTATLASTLSTAFGITVAVSGTAGTSYVCTFPTASGDLPTMVATGAFTGGTTPGISVATTTPGVTGVNTRNVGSGTNQNLRAFALDIPDGAVKTRIVVNNGEAVWTGTVGYTGSGAAISQFTLNPFKDASGNFYSIVDNDPASAGTYS